MFNNDSGSVTQVTQDSGGCNFFWSCMGVVVGIALFLGAIPLLWWNEGRSIKLIRTLELGARSYVAAEAGHVDGALEGKLVFLTGTVSTPERLSDATFGLSVTAIRLKRMVEMYQWQEHKDSHTEKQFGGGSTTVTTYSYGKEWSEAAIDSSAFKNASEHKNPASLPFASQEFTTHTARLGAHALPEALCALLTTYTPYPATATLAAHLPAGLTPPLQLTHEVLQSGDPASPRIGDVRVHFSIIPPGPVSVLAQQHGTSFTPYQFPTGALVRVESGTHTAAELLTHMRRENNALTWLLRGVGALMMIIGLALMMGPITAAANVVPVLGDLTGMITGGIACLVGVGCAAGTVAIAWLAVRPLVGIPLLAGAVVLLVLGVAALIKRRAK